MCVGGWIWRSRGAFRSANATTIAAFVTNDYGVVLPSTIRREETSDEVRTF